MKLKIFIAAAALVIFTACSTSYRATDTGLVITTDARNAFDMQYPNSSNIIWRTYDPDEYIIVNEWDMTGWAPLDENVYIVQFDYNGERHYAWYDRNGEWVGTAVAVSDYTTLPTMVNTTITSQYPAYTITSVNREYHRDRIVYEVSLKKPESKMVLLVDGNGNVIKSKVKTD